MAEVGATLALCPWESVRIQQVSRIDGPSSLKVFQEIRSKGGFPA